MGNKIIRETLINRKNSCLEKLESIPNLDSFINKILNRFFKFNFHSYKKKLKKEILKNLKEWWVNPAKGIDKEEKLLAVLFEYGHFFKKNVKAEAYGIGEWKNHKAYTDKFDMGVNYDFTKEFYASPGITLNFFDTLYYLDEDKLPKKYTDEGLNLDNYNDGDIIVLNDSNSIELVAGYDELIELHKLEGLIAIHDVLVELDENKEFESLNYANNFMFLIDEHDSGEVYPLLIKSK